MENENYTNVKTSIKVGETLLLDDNGNPVLDKNGKEGLTKSIKEDISFLVPKLSFFAQAISAQFSEAVEGKDAGYHQDAIAQWLFDAIISKCRSVLTSRVKAVEGKLAWVEPYQPWSNFSDMVKVLGQRGRVGGNAKFIADFTRYILTLGKSEKFVSQRVELVSDNAKLAAQNETVKGKIADILGAFFATLTDEEKSVHADYFSTLMSVIGKEQIDDLED